MKWLCGDWGADTNEGSRLSEEHGNETGLADPSRSVKQKLVISVGNRALTKSSFEDELWCCCACETDYDIVVYITYTDIVLLAK